MKGKILLSVLSILLTTMTFGQTQSNWQSWLAEVRQEALVNGIPPGLFDSAFANVREPNRRIKNLARSQPEHRLSFYKYRKTRVDSYRVTVGRSKYQKNKILADRIARDFHIDPCFMLSFWGMETSYGSYMGNFPVIPSLATLAYDSKRKAFFRKELFIALEILKEGHVTLKNFKGEWAGASGHPQFLPSSWVKYAVDYDGDGHKDIWTSIPDALASIANYMKVNGWRENEPWAIYVKLPAHFDKSLEGKNIVKPVSEWNAMGVRTASGQPLPASNLEGSIIQPYGGPTFLAYPNYKMILKYNNSIYYAGSIGYLADKICRREQIGENS